MSKKSSKLSERGPSQEKCGGCGGIGKVTGTSKGDRCDGCFANMDHVPQKFRSGLSGGGGLVSEGGYGGGGYSDRNEIRLAAPPGIVGGPGGGFGGPGFGGLLGGPGGAFGGPFGGLPGLGRPSGPVVVYVGAKKETKKAYVQTKSGQMVEVDRKDLKGTGVKGICTKKDGVETCIFPEKELKDKGLKLDDDESGSDDEAIVL